MNIGKKSSALPILEINKIDAFIKKIKKIKISKTYEVECRKTVKNIKKLD